MAQRTTRPTPKPEGTAPPAASASGLDLVKGDLPAVITHLGTDTGTGLSGADAAARLKKDGPNALPDKTEPAWKKALSYFTGPIAYMIEAAAIVSARCSTGKTSASSSACWSSTPPWDSGRTARPPTPWQH